MQSLNYLEKWERVKRTDKQINDKNVLDRALNLLFNDSNISLSFIFILNNHHSLNNLRFVQKYKILNHRSIELIIYFTRYIIHDV